MSTVIMISISVKPPEALFGGRICFIIRFDSSLSSMLDPGQAFCFGVGRNIEPLGAGGARNRLIDDVGGALRSGDHIYAAGRIRLDTSLQCIRDQRSVLRVGGERIGEHAPIRNSERVGVAGVQIAGTRGRHVVGGDRRIDDERALEEHWVENDLLGRSGKVRVPTELVIRAAAGRCALPAYCDVRAIYYPG